jgi:predicted AlkP superfamily pyrophosphatase or phosphodiesterase
MAAALGIPELPQAFGEVIKESKAKFGVLILTDGFQYQTLQSMIKAGDLPFLSSIQDQIYQGLTVYPPVTVASSAAFLTGAPPQIIGVYGHGFRSTELTTLFDLAVQEGKSVVAVEGASLPFNLRSAETTISGDQDGDGFSDDNVLTNALDVIQAGMPDLLYIHFHEIDDMGHSYGPESEEYQAAAVRVDNYLSQIYAALPSDTFIIIFADHGMHAEGEGGNHGNLIASDLIIPILFLEK